MILMDDGDNNANGKRIESDGICGGGGDGSGI